MRSARSVCELYSEALAPTRITTRNSSLRLFTSSEPERDDVLVLVLTDPGEGFESARVQLPAGIAALTAEGRARLVLEVVHRACLRLGQARGWDPAALEAARQHAVDAGLRFEWSGRWKSSPDRRHEARPVYRLQNDGYGRVVIEVRQRGGQDLVGVSASALAFSTSEGFTRSARTLRWRGSHTVELVPYSGLLGEERGLLTFTLSPQQEGRQDREDGWSPVGPGRATTGSTSDVPLVVVRGEGATAAEAGPCIRLGGGEMVEGVPHVYLTALDELLASISADPSWLAWWSAADVDVLEGFSWFSVDVVRATARRGKNRLRVSLERPVGTFAGAGDLVALAREDVERMLELVRRRTGLGPYPALPGLPALSRDTATRQAKWAGALTVIRDLLDRLSDRLPGWLVDDLRDSLNDGGDGDVLDALRVQVAALGVDLTGQERQQLNQLLHENVHP